MAPAKAGAGLLDLPDELLLSVVHSLGPAALASLGGCCRRLHNLAAEPAVWHTFCSRAGLPLEVPRRGEGVDFRQRYCRHANTTWRWRTGQLQSEHALRAHRGAVNAISLSPTAHTPTLVTGGADKTVRVWDLSRRLCVDSLAAGAAVFCVQCDPSNTDAVWVSGSSALVRKFAISERKVTRQLRGHTGAVYEVCSAGRLVASASEDGCVGLWDAFDPDPRGWITSHVGPVHCVKQFHHRNLVLSGGNDGTVRMFDTTTLQSVGPRVRMQPVYCLNVCGDLLMAGCEGGVVTVLDGRMCKCITTFLAHQGSVSCVEFDRFGAVTAGDDGVRVWDMRKWLSPQSPDLSPDATPSVYSLSLSHSVRAIARTPLQLFASAGNDVFMFDYGADTSGAHLVVGADPLPSPPRADRARARSDGGGNGGGEGEREGKDEAGEGRGHEKKRGRGGKAAAREGRRGHQGEGGDGQGQGEGEGSNHEHTPRTGGQRGSGRRSKGRRKDGSNRYSSGSNFGKF